MLKNKFNESNKCLECNVSFEKGTNNKNFYAFNYHLKRTHELSSEEYYVKHFLYGVPVLCACGCGTKTRFFKGKYYKYFSNHKNFVFPSESELFKMKKANEKINNIDNLLKKTDISYEALKQSYDDFINLKNPISVLSEELFIDFRTLKSYWLKAGLIENKEIFKRICLKSQTMWLNKVLKPKENIIEILKQNLFLIKEKLKEEKKITFNEIDSIIGLEVNRNYLSLFLRENLTSIEIKKIKFAKQSQLEIEFFNVLKFYFKKSVINSFELDGKIYDYKLGKNILIELDGEYWHSIDIAKKNDKIKDAIAKRNNFILIRISDKCVRDLQFINKIKKIYEKNKKI